MATGRADFWYGRPFVVVDVPLDGDSEDAPTANWAYNHAVNPSAHHVRYSDAEAVLAMGVTGNLNPLNHNRYSGGEAQDAMGVKANYNPFNHDRYADSEAVTAMGAKANANPLNHDRHSDAQIQSVAWPVYIGRGDPVTDDYTDAFFTKNGTWRDLNMSAVVPAGAKAVLLKVFANATTAGKQVAFRKNGLVNGANYTGFFTQVANGSILCGLVCEIDSNRYCEYNIAAATWSWFYVCVLGWWK